MIGMKKFNLERVYYMQSLIPNFNLSYKETNCSFKDAHDMISEFTTQLVDKLAEIVDEDSEFIKLVNNDMRQNYVLSVGTPHGNFDILSIFSNGVMTSEGTYFYQELNFKDLVSLIEILDEYYFNFIDTYIEHI